MTAPPRESLHNAATLEADDALAIELDLRPRVRLNTPSSLSDDDIHSASVSTICSLTRRDFSSYMTGWAFAFLIFASPATADRSIHREPVGMKISFEPNRSRNLTLIVYEIIDPA
jgi:hypothetical protein